MGEVLGEAIDDTVGRVHELIPEEASALMAAVQPVSGLFGDWVKGCKSRYETHRVREVAAFGALPWRPTYRGGVMSSRGHQVRSRP